MLPAPLISSANNNPTVHPIISAWNKNIDNSQTQGRCSQGPTRKKKLWTNGKLLMSGPWEQLWISAELSPRLCLLILLTSVTEIFPKIWSLHFSLLLRAGGSVRDRNGSALTEFVLYKSVGCSFLLSSSGCTKLGWFGICISGKVYNSLISFFLVPVIFHPSGKHLVPLSKTPTELCWGWRTGWSWGNSFRTGSFESIYEQSTDNELSCEWSQLILLLTGAFSPFDCCFPRPDSWSWHTWNLSSPNSWSPFLSVFNLIPVFLSDNLFYSTIFPSEMFFPF